MAEQLVGAVDQVNEHGELLKRRALLPEHRPANER